MTNHTTLPFGVSLIFFDSDYDESLHRELVTAGVQTVEINSKQLETAQQRETVRGLLASGEIRATSIHSRFGGDCDYSSLYPDIWQQAVNFGIEAVNVAAELDIPLIVAHASIEPISPEERSRRFARAVEGLAIVGKQAKASGRRIAIEYLPRTCLGNSLPELLELLEQLDDDTFGVCLDVNHLMDRYRELPDVVRGLESHLITTHISDCDAQDEKHWLPGEGVLDWRGFVQTLGEIGYRGPFTYECNMPGDTPTEKLAVLKKNLLWLNGFVVART